MSFALQVLKKHAGLCPSAPSCSCPSVAAATLTSSPPSSSSSLEMTPTLSVAEAFKSQLEWAFLARPSPTTQRKVFLSFSSTFFVPFTTPFRACIHILDSRLLLSRISPCAMTLCRQVRTLLVLHTLRPMPIMIPHTQKLPINNRGMWSASKLSQIKGVGMARRLHFQ